MAKDNDNGDEQKSIEEMSDKEMLLEIIRISSSDTITSEELSQILGAAQKITSKPNKPEPDDTNET
jgi:hypothetical protein